MPDDRPLMTVAQVAERLTMSERHVWREIHAGRLAAKRVGRMVRVEPAELDRYLRSLPTVAA